MNPFLLLGLFGLTGLFARGSSSSSSSTDTASATGKVPTTPPVSSKDQNDDRDDDPAPEAPVVGADPQEMPTNDPAADAGQPDPVAEQPDPEPVAEQPDPEPVTAPDPEPVTAPDPEPVAEQPDPEPDPQPQPQPSPPAQGSVTPPEGPDQTGGTDSNGGETAPVAAQGSVSVYAGRVTTLDPIGSDVASVEILSDVSHGSLTVNPDNTLGLVMTRSDFIGTQSFQYQVTSSSGATSTHSVTLNVQRGEQDDGWGTGEDHYMLATDENDRVIVEHGENHVKVHVTGAADGLTRAEIAAMEGVSQGTVTGEWIAANTSYGQTEGTALSVDLGLEMWEAVSPRSAETSNWLLLERGYEYDLGNGYNNHLQLARPLRRKRVAARLYGRLRRRRTPGSRERCLCHQ